MKAGWDWLLSQTSKTPYWASAMWAVPIWWTGSTIGVVAHVLVKHYLVYTPTWLFPSIIAISLLPGFVWLTLTMFFKLRRALGWFGQ